MLDFDEALRELASAIGNTPMLRLKRLSPPGSSVWLKLEFANPTGSHKDRIVYYMLKDLRERGELKPGDVVVEASSGNTAISLAWMARALGLKAALVVWKGTSPAKLALLKLLGAEVYEVERPEEPPSDPRRDPLVEAAAELAEKLGGHLLNQYANEANHLAHYETTGPEVARALKGEVSAFVMGVGTGGTVTGVGRYLKEALGRSVKVVAVAPRGAATARGRAQPGYDVIEGLVSISVPPLFEKYSKYVDEVKEVSLSQALESVRKLAQAEGLAVGPSTGAALKVALEVASEVGGNVVAVAADSLLRYPEALELVLSSARSNAASA